MAMAYTIYFSGLIAFLEYKDYSRVDVLLLNPAPAHSHGAGQEHANEAQVKKPPCSDQHVSQLMVRMSDLEAWNLCGVGHGCGWRHFDLAGKTLFPELSGNRIVDVTKTKTKAVPLEQFPFKYALSPFKTSVVDLSKVLGRRATPASYSSVSVTARIRLPKGTLMAMTGRRPGDWRVGKQKLNDLPELFKFVPNQRDSRINIAPTCGAEGAFFKVRESENPDDVQIWITNEPLCCARAEESNDAPHFRHAYDLIFQETLEAARRDGRDPRPIPVRAGKQANIDDPICPAWVVHTDDPI
jgi:hypothetical protein